MRLAQILMTSIFAAGTMMVPASVSAKKPTPYAEDLRKDAPRIQVALLLDTSNSMDGLISQAKSQLWMLVNELAEGEKNGLKPNIELALYEYGNSDISVAKGYVRQVLSLTTDLDAVSEELFALDTNGGQEYAGMVMATALDELEWSRSKKDLKLMIIAGNEPFTQGPVKFESACERAHDRGVIIDTIHCGNEALGANTGWKDGADCGGGIYMTIDQDEESVYVKSPYDDEIVELNKKLNETYIGYGVAGRGLKQRQITQDMNAETMSKKSVIARAKSKASGQYRNESWDIVDAYEADSSKILAMPETEMPEEMQGMSAEERKSFIETKQRDRAGIAQSIKRLEKQRQDYVAQQKSEQSGGKTLEDVMVRSVKEQARANGFVFPQE